MSIYLKFSLDNDIPHKKCYAARHTINLFVYVPFCLLC